jgi:hypothetical protein
LPFPGKEFVLLIDIIYRDHTVGDEKIDVAHSGVEAYCHLNVEPAWFSRRGPGLEPCVWRHVLRPIGELLKQGARAFNSGIAHGWVEAKKV